MKRLNQSGTPFEKMLLRSAKDDAPPPGTKERSMQRLGLFDVPPPAPPSGPTPGAQLIRRIRHWLFYAAIAALSGAALLPGNSIDSNTIIGDKHSSWMEPAPPPLESTANSIKLDAPPSPAPPPQAPEAQPSKENTTAPSKPGPSKAKPGQKESAPTLREEIALVDQARDMLRIHKNPAAALGILDKHQARFPHGDLRNEALLLRAEAQRALDQQHSPRSPAP